MGFGTMERERERGRNQQLIKIGAKLSRADFFGNQEKRKLRVSIPHFFSNDTLEQ